MNRLAASACMKYPAQFWLESCVPGVKASTEKSKESQCGLISSKQARHPFFERQDGSQRRSRWSHIAWHAERNQLSEMPNCQLRPAKKEATSSSRRCRGGSLDTRRRMGVMEDPLEDRQFSIPLMPSCRMSQVRMRCSSVSVAEGWTTWLVRLV